MILLQKTTFTSVLNQGSQGHLSSSLEAPYHCQVQSRHFIIPGLPFTPTIKAVVFSFIRKLHLTLANSGEFSPPNCKTPHCGALPPRRLYKDCLSGVQGLLLCENSFQNFRLPNLATRVVPAKAMTAHFLELSDSGG